MGSEKIFEYRIQRLLFHRGFFARRNLTIRSYFYPDSVDVTDIDVLGIRFSDNFHPEVTICECKSGRTNGTVDRILWMNGLSHYLSADNCVFARPRIKAKIKNFANELGVIPVDSSLLIEMEKNNEIPDEWIGSFDYKYYESRIPKYYTSIRRDPKLSKVYWLLRSRFWFDNNITRLKKSLTGLDILVNHNETEAQRWLLFESCILLSISIIWLCHEAHPFTSKERSDYIKDMLTTGLGSKENAKKLLDATYGVLFALMKEKGVEPSIVDYEHLRLIPPNYSQSLIDLIERFNHRPKETVQIPRFLDLFCYEFLFKGNKIDEDKLKEFFPNNIDLIAKLSKNIVRFVTDNKKISEKIFEPLLNF